MSLPEGITAEIARVGHCQLLLAQCGEHFDEELLGLYLVSVSRGTNLLLDVGTDKHGLIPEKYLGARQRLRANIDKLGM